MISFRTVPTYLISRYYVDLRLATFSSSSFIAMSQFCCVMAFLFSILTISTAQFYDATVITRKLGYGYLWIDSLCIIQDSADDWEAEGQNMGNIYMNASLTIAAAGAKDSDGGMLRDDYRVEDMGAQLGQPARWLFQDRRVLNLYQFAEAKPKHTTVSEAEDNNTRNKSTSSHLKIHEGERSEIVSLEPWFLFSDKEENWYRL